ncbi:MAG TPA: hypothetical protein VHX37_11585 [Acidobacteriaceae bacterium]|jgi:hypothetical protein|nr:hypothetical protein [Acidobacteriaceae bacterium]
MVANCDRTCALLRRILVAASAVALGASLSAAAQTSLAANNSPDGQGYSSSAVLSTDALLGDAPASPASAADPSPQYGGGRSNYPNYPNYQGRMSHIAFEGGAGFTAPIGNDTSFSQSGINNGDLSPSESWGYNINVGAGWNFTKKFGTLLEYRFNRESMASDYLDAFSTVNGLSGSGLGGNINTWSLTLDPVYYLPMGRKNGVYVTGGGGFYRKVTNFTEPACGEDIYYGYYCVSSTAYHFSSNQGGAEGGVGFYRKVFGQDSNAKFFAQVKYVWVDSPKPGASNYGQGEGTESLLPITFGIRF